MSDAIKIHKRHSFTVINDLIYKREDLSPSAKYVLGWMLGRPDTWVIYISHMTSEIKITEKTWRSAKKEMVAAGFFSQTREKGEKGLFVWTNTVTDAPLYATSPIHPPLRMDGVIHPPFGMDAGGGDIPSLPDQDNYLLQQNHAHASAGAGAGARKTGSAGKGQGSAQASGGMVRHRADDKKQAKGGYQRNDKQVKQKAWPLISELGVTCWNQSDVDALKQIQGRFGGQAIEIACKDLNQIGVEALPSRVAKQITANQKTQGANNHVINSNQIKHTGLATESDSDRLARQILGIGPRWESTATNGNIIEGEIIE